MQKKKKRKKLRIGRLFLLILILITLFYLIYKFLDIPIRNVIIKGNKILTDNEIMKISNLDNYPSYFKITTFGIKKKLEKNEYIKNAKVRKGLLNIIIEIKENKVLFVNPDTMEKVMKETKIKDDKIICVPFLKGSIPSNKYDEFIFAMMKIDSNILCKMSEITYDPNDIDKDRYYVYMNDGNGVYLTVNKFNKINKYDKILENVGKQKGILYLDYGDYFEVK